VTGCAAVLLSDSGRFPERFIDGGATYSSPDQIPGLIKRLVEDASWANSVAKAGCAIVRDRDSKERQWTKFQTTGMSNCSVFSCTC
jgi:hypothetical protein